MPSLSMYALNKIRDITPPCFTPLATVNCVEIVLPKRHCLVRVYQKHNNLVKNTCTCLFNNLSNNN